MNQALPYQLIKIPGTHLQYTHTVMKNEQRSETVGERRMQK